MKILIIFLTSTIANCQEPYFRLIVKDKFKNRESLIADYYQKVDGLADCKNTLRTWTVAGYIGHCKPLQQTSPPIEAKKHAK